MEQMHTQVLLNGQLAAFLRIKKLKRQPIDHLIKLVCAFVPYASHVSVYMYNKHT